MRFLEGRRPACLLLALGMWAGAGRAQQVEPASLTATEVCNLIKERGREALPTAMEALVAGRGGASGRNTITQSIADRQLESSFVMNAYYRILEDRLPGSSMRRGFRDPEQVRALLLAVLNLQRISPTRSMSIRELWELFKWTDPETSVLLTKIACADSSVTGCLWALKAAGLCKAPSRASYAASQMIAVRSLRSIRPDDLEDYDRSDLRDGLWLGTDKIFAMAVRLEALAGLRRYWPTKAGEALAKMAAEERTEAEYLELERLFVEAETVGARCEALFLLGAAGRTERVGKKLKEKLKAEEAVGEERSKLEFAVRLLHAGKKARD